jgi:hypothetical protein
MKMFTALGQQREQWKFSYQPAFLKWIWILFSESLSTVSVQSLSQYLQRFSRVMKMVTALGQQHERWKFSYHPTFLMWIWILSSESLSTVSVQSLLQYLEIRFHVVTDRAHGLYRNRSRSWSWSWPWPKHSWSTQTFSNIKVENSFIVFQCVFGWYGTGNGLREHESVHGWFVGIIWFVTFVLQLLPMRWTRWKNNLCRAIPCEFEPVNPIMLHNPLGAGWGLLLTLWWVGSSLPTYLFSLFPSSREKISQRESNCQPSHLGMGTSPLSPNNLRSSWTFP